MKKSIILGVLSVAALYIPGACAAPTATAPAPVTPAEAKAPAPASAASPAATIPPPANQPAAAPAETQPVAPVKATAPAAAPAPMAPADPSAITYKELKIAPGTVKVGETAKVTVSVTNTGGALNFPVELKVNGKVVDEQALVCKIDIDCDETKQVNFDLKMASSGTYTVSVGDQTTKLVVQ